MSENEAKAPAGALAAQRNLEAFIAGRRRPSADELVERMLENKTLLRNRYPPDSEEIRMTEPRPGDIVSSETTGRLWFVHGHPGVELFLTSATGTCVSIADAIRLYGMLAVHCRPTEHRPMSRSHPVL